MTELGKQAKNPIKSAKTTVRIIEELKKREGAGVSELVDTIGLPKSSIHNYLATLEEEGYIVKKETKYHVGLRFLEIGSFARQRWAIYEEAKPEVRSLANETGELANLLVEEYGKGVYICRERGDQAVKVDSYTGQRVHLHNTALGKAILAHTAEERVDQIIDHHGLPKTTQNTIDNHETLSEELTTIRERGVAFDDEERLTGLRCVAAPILNREGVAEGAISVAGPSNRFRGEFYEEELPNLLKNAANVIELNTTYS